MIHDIELLAPAKDLVCGITAINCGADAVYIGAPRFSARSAAGNSIEDIRQLIHYAHIYHSRVYIALNTLFKNEELPEAISIAYECYEAGADALIIQDMGLLECTLPPMPLFASTQTDNRTPEKVKFLEEVGFKRVILARELTLSEIKNIRKNTAVDLEFFIHGALCVSYSGRCSMSYACGGRSANRGECAQPCRMTYDLINEQGKVLEKNRHLLSLKDLNLTNTLGELLDSGITSFKIEGRLKDEAYVKNVVSHYRKELDLLLEGGNFRKSSSGITQIEFEPDPLKTFNRGYTDYFTHGRDDSMGSPNTQKSIGEPIGAVVKVEGGYFILDKKSELSNGDGICFFDNNGVLGGMVIDKVDGESVYPHDIRFIKPGYFIYRNFNHHFDKVLKTTKIVRKIKTALIFEETKTGFVLKIKDEEGNQAEASILADKVPAEKPEKALDNIQKQLVKLGDTPFVADSTDVLLSIPYFIPISQLNDVRRQAAQALLEERFKVFTRQYCPIVPNSTPYPLEALDYQGNVLNQKAKAFYERHQVKTIQPAAESGLDLRGKKVMTTRYCIKNQLGICPKLVNSSDSSGKLYLTDGKREFELRFNCSVCEMEIYLTE